MHPKRSRTVGRAARSARAGALVVAAIVAIAASAGGAQMVVPKPALPSGEKLFAQQCGVCHSIAPGEHRVGPSLAGVMMRKAGRAPGFAASPALRKSGLTWTPATLDRWLADSAAAVPGSVMNYRQADAAKRSAIIAFLQSPGR